MMLKRRIIVYPILLLVVLLSALLAADHWFPPNLQRAHDHSTLVVDHQGTLLRGFTTSQDSWRLPVTPEQVDPLFLQMLLAYEDKRFYQHPGVDPFAVARALWQWLSNGRIVSGASTLTMQTARLLQPRPRTLPGKFKEMLRAVQLEWHYTKSDILEFYLTLAPYGGNLEGLRAASLAYFGKEPKQLTAAEAALLVVLPQSPSTLRPDRFPRRAQTARDKVLQRMHTLGVLTARQVAEARQDEVPARRHAMPMHAPHLARRLRNQGAPGDVHDTTLHYELQRMLETLAKRELEPLDDTSNLAIVVADNRSHEIIAYVGSADFFASRRAGQIDLARAIRSPGSTLKPVIYGLGFDDLIIHPETIIDDIPTRFGDYRPSNFRNDYRGQVSIREALQHSLNIPAVAVLERVGPGRVAARLRQAGIELHWSSPGATRQPGLPLALGGVGTTLVDLVTLYSGIANYGRVTALKYRRDDEDEPAYPLLSEVASWYLKRILEATPPPQTLIPLANTLQPRRIAYKTGTSYGFRDAWAIGFDRNFTVGIWSGRADGSPSPERYGRNTAAPLLFRIFDILPEPDPLPTESPPTGVLMANHTGLPQRLQYFDSPAEINNNRQVATEPLLITFPLDGSSVELAGHDPHAAAGVPADLPLIASGGRKPLRWLVNGRPLASSLTRRQTFWTPDGGGLARITVIDKQGSSASAEVWITH